MTTVGYGDVNPQNTGERIFVILLMVTGVLLFSFMSGSLAAVLQSYDDHEQQQRTMLEHLGVIKEKFKMDDKQYALLMKEL